ncbi:hypothetical protein C8J56DRAFT_920252 [Mycena floridula]|nr:hypothetical protein C8J56DRAFT_920252 [Mycena floridula]
MIILSASDIAGSSKADPPPDTPPQQNSLFPSYSSNYSTPTLSPPPSNASTSRSGRSHSRTPKPPAPIYPQDRPAKSICYAFLTMPSNAMVLVPPDNTVNAHPPYHISVSLNVFTPTSFITTIRRNKRDGEFVGSFEIGPFGSRTLNTVCLGSTEYPLNEVMHHTLFRNTWSWKTLYRNKGVTLYWDARISGGNVLTCFASKEKSHATMLAKFIPKGQPPAQGRRMDYPKLEVTPQGHDLFDDIIISGLLIERLRTTPFTS